MAIGAMVEDMFEGKLSDGYAVWSVGYGWRRWQYGELRSSSSYGGDSQEAEQERGRDAGRGGAGMSTAHYK